MKLPAALLLAVLAATTTTVACTNSELSNNADLSNANGSASSIDPSTESIAPFESDNPDDSTFTDDAGNELQVGENLALPPDWPGDVPIPDGSLIAVSVVDAQTAVATWQIDGDVLLAEQSYVEQLASTGFTVTKSDDLSTEANTVYTAVGNGLDVTVSATSGEKETDPGEITVLVNPGL